MSMSQEEIEALMSGLDIQDEDSSDIEEQDIPTEVQEENDTMSEDDIAALIAQTDISAEEVVEETPIEEEKVVVEETPVANEIAIEESPIVEETEESLDDIINNFQEDSSEEVIDENIDDILAGIEGMTNNTPSPEVAKCDVPDNEAIARSWTDNQINQGIFPLPVEREHKVVNQLSQVANDSEEQASKIFDVLSFILDENNIIQKNTKSLDGFVTKQIVLLETLCKKFPNVAAFQTNLELAKSMQTLPQDTSARVEAENMQLFQAMELMQFHDINRQKIERVMSVIKKLSTYLNGLFEDDSGYQEVATAKHIHGDVNNELVNELDLDALIAEFGN